MNEHDPLEQTLAKFREIVPPEGVRDRNRKVLRIALDESTGTRWWRRSVTVPIPVVLATTAVLLISLSIQLFRAQGSGEPSAPDVAVEPSGGGEHIETTLVATTDPHIEYSETQRYLSGVGVIDRNIIYGIKE